MEACYVRKKRRLDQVMKELNIQQGIKVGTGAPRGNENRAKGKIIWSLGVSRTSEMPSTAQWRVTTARE